MRLSDIMRLKNLKFGYPKKEVLKDINLTISNNELVCLLGVNGAGKSTLLKSILGILKIQSGEIYIHAEGDDKNSLKRIHSPRKHTDEDDDFLPNLTTVYGMALLLWGLIVTAVSESQSISSFAPAFLGLPLLVSGEMVKTPEADRKLWMYIATTFGILGSLGGIGFFIVMGDGLNYTSSSMLMMFVTGSAYTAVCVRWFTAAKDASNDDNFDAMELAQYMSYVPQSVKSSFSIDVYDAIMLGRRPYIGWNISPMDREIVSKTIEFLNLEEFAFRKLNQLSGGERQRVIIGKAIAQSPRLFLLDEPTSDLDLKNQIQIMKKMKFLVSNSKVPKSALVAIHDINMAARFADRILLMSEGKIIADGTPREVLTPENIQKVFGVTADVVNSEEGDRFWVHVRDEVDGKTEDDNLIWEQINEDTEG